MQMRKNLLRLLCGLVVIFLALPLYGMAEESPSTRWADAADEIDKFLDAAFEAYLDGDPSAAYDNVSNAYFQIYEITGFERQTILLPASLYGKPAPEEEAANRLEEFGIGHLADAMPKELSGGELRRMAVVRALAGHPDILFADEPTGDLDDENTEKVLSALEAYAHQGGKAVFIVTHENDALKYTDRVLRMDKGRMVADE